MKTFKLVLRAAAAFAAAVAISVLSSATIMFAQTTSTASDVPRAVSYQGLLTQSGAPVPDGLYNVTVGFYTDPGGANRVWQGTYSVQTVNGVFSVILGTGASPFTNAAMFNQTLWVGVAFNGGTEMRPLAMLASAPSALAIPNGSVTAAKMGTNYLAGIAVNGNLVTGKGAVLNLAGGDNTHLEWDSLSNSVIVNVDGIAAGQAAGDTNAGKWKKGGGAATMGIGNVVKDGPTVNGATPYITMWSQINGAGLNDYITNSSIFDNGTQVVFNTAPGGATAALTETESSGNLTWSGANDVKLSMGNGKQALYIDGANGSSSSGAGGAIYINAGDAYAGSNSNGGPLVIRSGNGDSTGTGTGGPLIVAAGASKGTNSVGGVLQLTSGTAIGTGASNGYLLLECGADNSSFPHSGSGAIWALADTIRLQGGVDVNAMETSANPYTVVDTDYLVVETTSASTVNLPNAPPNGRIVAIQNNNTGGNVTVAASGTDKIANVASVTVASNGGITVIYDATGKNWAIVGKY